MITITIEIRQQIQPITIQASIAEKIKHFNEASNIAKEQRLELQRNIIKLRDTMLAELNQGVGVELWKLDTHSFNKIGFRDGIYKNTCYNDWDIEIWYESKVIKLGELNYIQPNVEKGIYIKLTSTHRNHEYSRIKGNNQVVHNVTDLSKVHELCEKDYLTYFTHISK